MVTHVTVGHLQQFCDVFKGTFNVLNNLYVIKHSYFIYISHRVINYKVCERPSNQIYYYYFMNLHTIIQNTSNCKLIFGQFASKLNKNV